MRSILILGGIVALVLIAAGLAVVPNPLGAAVAGAFHDITMDSTLTYQVQVWSDAPLSDLELIVPLPAGPGSEVIADALARGDVKEWPEGWKLTILEAPTVTMLKIQADRLGEAPGDSTTLRGLFQTARSRISHGPWEENLVVRARPGRFIATDAPEGKEPLLQPRYNLTGSACGCSVNLVGEQSGRFLYDSPVFTGYQSPEHTTVGVWVRVQGVNRWWAYHWSSNYYSDSLRLVSTDGSDRWIPAMGIQTQNRGRYGRPVSF
ncbi:MAG: hypothetical protein LUO86_01475 [Methanomicrobiales archaeon]|nr:hypothetical protein [Methanomicrobiales archaeon]MDD1655542.1 hypothetical protein [Methanomicrobiales archaeon]